MNVKYNTRLKYNNTTPFSLNNYLLKCVQHTPNVFYTENLSIHYKILIGLKDQLDLHKLLYFFFYENKTCTLRLIFLLIFFGKHEEIVILTIQEEEYLVRYFQLNGVDNPCVDSVLSRAIPFFTKLIWCFSCFVDIFCYLERLWPSESCLLANCQLRNID